MFSFSPRICREQRQFTSTSLARSGRFGPYVQLGHADDVEGKPKTASLFRSMSLDTVTFEEALRLLTLPRMVGVDPATGEEITALNGRYGPYLKRGKETRSLDAEEELFAVTLDDAVRRFAEPKRRRGQRAAAPLRELGVDPDTGCAIVVKDGRPFMVTGCEGGPRIITATLQSILNVVDYGMDVQEAVSAPRFHHQWVPDRLQVGPAIPADVIQALRSRGHQVEVSKRNWSSAQAIVVDPASGLHLGGSDPRGDGVALGYSPSIP